MLICPFAGIGGRLRRRRRRRFGGHANVASFGLEDVSRVFIVLLAHTHTYEMFVPLYGLLIVIASDPDLMGGFLEHVFFCLVTVVKMRFPPREGWMKLFMHF